MIAYEHEPVAHLGDETGFVSLFGPTDDPPRRWVVSYRDGGISGSEPFEAEVDARRAYDRLRRTVGSMR